jgi:hypothetical protein
VLLTIILAAITWRLVEQPFRHREASTWRIAATVTACVAIFAGFGGWGVAKDGLPFRLPPAVQSFMSKSTWSSRCLFQVMDGLPDLPDEKCVFNANASTKYAVWGDSIGASFSPALSEMLASRDIGLVQLTHGFCAPVSNVSIARYELSADCGAFNHRALNYLLGSDVDTVVLAAAWVDFFAAKHMQIDDVEFSGQDIGVSSLQQNVNETVAALRNAGKKVFLLYPSPRFAKRLPEQMAAEMMRGNEKPTFEYPLSEFRRNTLYAYEILNAVKGAAVERVFPEMIFCDVPSGGVCTFGRDGVAYIADNVHYTVAGANLVADAVFSSLMNQKHQASLVSD